MDFSPRLSEYPNLVSRSATGTRTGREDSIAANAARHRIGFAFRGLKPTATVLDRYAVDTVLDRYAVEEGLHRCPRRRNDSASVKEGLWLSDRWRSRSGFTLYVVIASEPQRSPMFL